MRLSKWLALLFGAMLLEIGPLSAQYLGPSAFGIAAQVQAGRSYLGVRLRDIDSDRARELKLEDPRGVEVIRVEEESPAAHAGIRPGDVLLTYNGENIVGALQLGRLVAETPADRKIKIQYWRDGKMQSTVVTTAAAKPQEQEFPPTFPAVAVPGFGNWATTDVPTPLVVWRNMVLGIECEPMDPQLAKYFGVKEGVLIRSVDKGSAGDRAGLRAGDVITSLGDHPVAAPRDVISYMRMQHQPGKPVTIVLVRSHNELTVVVMTSPNRG